MKSTIRMNRTTDGRYAAGTNLSRRAISVRAYITDDETIERLAKERGLTLGEVTREAIALGIGQLQKRLEAEKDVINDSIQPDSQT
jgi:hypothetical protein